MENFIDSDGNHKTIIDCKNYVMENEEIFNIFGEFTDNTLTF